MQGKDLTPSWILRIVSIGFLFGIVVASFAHPFPDGKFSFYYFWFSLVVVAFVTFLFFEFKKFRKVLLPVIIASSLFATGFGHYALMARNDSEGFAEGEVFIEGVVVDSEQGTEKQKLIVKVLGQNDRLLIFAPVFPKIHYGDSLRFTCDLLRAEAFNGFSYDRYLATKDIFYTCFLHESPMVVDSGRGSVVIGALARVHDKIVEKIDQTFGDPHASLLAGLLLGDQRFTDVWEDRFQRTGTTHIVAASGYNVTVVSFILFGFLVYFGIRRQYAFSILVLGIIAYVFLAGADAPVVRAGVMGVLVLTSKQIGRKTTMSNILLLVIVLMLIPEPRLLRDDVGFQLSILSTVGLIYFAPTVEKWFLFIPKTFALRESISATVVATIFTLPIIVFSFGNLSLISPIANLLILPIIPFAMAFGTVSIAVSFFSIPLGAVVAGPAWALLTYALWIVDSLASLPFVNIGL